MSDETKQNSGIDRALIGAVIDRDLIEKLDEIAVRNYRTRAREIEIAIRLYVDADHEMKGN